MAARPQPSSTVRWPHDPVGECVNTFAKLDTLESALPANSGCHPIFVPIGEDMETSVSEEPVSDSAPWKDYSFGPLEQALSAINFSSGWDRRATIWCR